MMIGIVLGAMSLFPSLGSFCMLVFHHQVPYGNVHLNLLMQNLRCIGYVFSENDCSGVLMALSSTMNKRLVEINVL